MSGTNREARHMRTERKTDVRNGVKRLIFVVLALIVQIGWLMLSLIGLGQKAAWLSEAVHILSLALVLLIYGKRTNAGFKLPWIILIMVFPLLGLVLYTFMGQQNATRATRKRFEEIDEKLMPYLQQDEETAVLAKRRGGRCAHLSGYLLHSCGYPIYGGTKIPYYDDAAKALEAQLSALESAKKFIFLEYHAIEDGESFARIREVLARRAKEGVDVRLFCDDIGSIGFITGDFIKRMEAYGIRTRVFNPVRPIFHIFMNNRDHRKITVIDGKVGFTGGYNLANEYFHLTEPYGYWKDTGIRMEGPGVRTLTILFLEMWNAINRDDIDDASFGEFFTEPVDKLQSEGFVQPYADSPLDNEPAGENVYISMLNEASDYVWFCTPYLLITDEMTRALSLAAQRGVDVRILTPGIPDKKLTYHLTRSYYAALARNGVRIFEYTPGFNHAKMCVSDDAVATVGTINMDYRSLYLHFENGVVLYDMPPVQEIRKDFEDMFQVSTEVTYKYSNRSSVMRLGQCILRLLAPLM